MMPSSLLPQTLRARWVWCRDQWIENGRVTWHAGRIVSVGTDFVPGETDLGDQLLLPALVNAHTHLEFSAIPVPIAYESIFASWIRHVVQWRRNETDESCRAAIEQGLAESRGAGVGLVGEISTGGWRSPVSIDAESTDHHGRGGSRVRLVVFDEILGLREDAIRPQMADACQHLILGKIRPANVQPSDWHPDWTPGLSPHAPYSLSRELLGEALTLASRARLPVAMHLAETREELEFLAAGTGPLAELFSEWGLWKMGDRAAFSCPQDVLRELAELERVLVIHGNYLGETDIDFLSGRDNFSVVYCPRTHAYFRHERYPLLQLLGRGIRVALGTDSRASNPDLNLMEEMRFVARAFPEVSPEVIIRMGTSSGAEALGLDSEFGRLEPGMRASFAIVPIPGGIRDPFEALFAD